MLEDDIVFRLRKRAEIRRNIPHRKSVQENQPDRIAALLDEAAAEIIKLRTNVSSLVRLTIAPDAK
jgi:hypothetical protein